MIARSRTGVLVAAAVALVAAVVAFAVQDPDGDDRSPAADELVALVEDGRELTYRASYESTLADPRAASTKVTLKVWRKGELSRQDLSVRNGDSTNQTSTFQLPDRTVRCTRVGDSPWSCAAQSPNKAEDPSAAAIEEEFANKATSVTDESIAGMPTRCFTFPGKQLSEACLTDEGVLARMVTAASSFELTSLTRDVAASVFELPAAPS